MIARANWLGLDIDAAVGMDSKHCLEERWNEMLEGLT